MNGLKQYRQVQEQISELLLFTEPSELFYVPFLVRF